MSTMYSKILYYKCDLKNEIKSQTHNCSFKEHNINLQKKINNVLQFFLGLKLKMNSVKI